MLGNYVENRVHFVDLSESYGINDRWSITLDAPYLHANRSSMYEHDLIHRGHMRSQGLGDVRLTSDYWLFDPHSHKNGNIAIGVGLKLPTGSDRVTNISNRATGPVYRPVDPSIQPGDGGWGGIIQLQAYHQLIDNLTVYFAGSYLVSPQEQNNTELTIADVPAFAAFITDDIRHDSIADQYSVRTGLSYYAVPSQGLSISLGYRLEGIPANDLIGGSMGFRRPGYTESVEPGVSWTHKNTSPSCSVPIAVYRNRIRSAPEAKLGRPTGDAASADYSIVASLTHAF